MLRTPIFSVLIIGTGLASCSAEAPAGPVDPGTGRAASLAKISGGCRLPAETLEPMGPNEVAIRLQPDVDFAKVDCLLEAIRKADPRLKFGFVANEAYGMDNAQ